MPGGSPVGMRGKGRQVRELVGGRQAAEKMFDDLKQGGMLNTPVGYPGQDYDLPGGGWVGLRLVSKSGEPTIDVQIPGVPVRKVKYK